MDTDALRGRSQGAPRRPSCCTIPSFQNPSGITTTLEKRKRCTNSRYQRYDIAILEDNLTASCASPARCRSSSMDTEGRVLYAAASQR